MRLVKLAIMLCCVVLPATASAQVAFPADAAFSPLRCNRAPMNDGFQDQAGAFDERDIVGNLAAPAGLRASDATYLYLRMRLDKDPAPGGAGFVRPSAWGMQFDLDGDLTTYELMVAVDGIVVPAGAGPAGAVSVFRNKTIMRSNDPSDPADLPAVVMYPFATNARSIAAPGSKYGGNADFFLDIAVPWSALVPLGLDRTTPTYVWAGTSSVANSLDGDLACHDGASGSASLDGTASDPTTGAPPPPPTPPPGGGPLGVEQLEGGGGCTAGGAGSPFAGLVLLALFQVVSPRRRKRT